VPDDAAQRAIDAVWRIESPRLIAGLARMARDVGVAEDLAQDALVAALEQWPRSGVPDNPGAWLMATALLYRLGRFPEAHADFTRAASLTRNERERELLLARAAGCAWA
jgi:predicted RNA polymerase sigma factor